MCKCVISSNCIPVHSSLSPNNSFVPHLVSLFGRPLVCTQVQFEVWIPRHKHANPLLTYSYCLPPRTAGWIVTHYTCASEILPHHSLYLATIQGELLFIRWDASLSIAADNARAKIGGPSNSLHLER